MQRKKTRQLSVLLPLAVLLLAVLTGCTSGSDRTEAPRIGTCRLSVRVDASCPEAPEDPELVSARDVVLREGDTVLDILLRGVADANPEHGEDNVRLIGGAYVSGIGTDAMPDLLYEKDMGPESGWVYTVNGAYVTVGAASRRVQDGDRIVWIYTCTRIEALP